MTIAPDPPEVTSASTAHSEVVVESPNGEEKNDAPRAVVNDRETSVPDDGNGDGDTPVKKV